jgi:hypothetical protein
MGKKSAPAAPDYTSAAQATATGNLDVARAQQAANMVNQTTPYGSLTYTQNGTDSFGNPRYTANVALSADQQALQNADTQTSLGLSKLEGAGLGYVGNQLSHPFDQSSLPSQAVNAGQTGQDAIMARMQPTLDMQRKGLENQLANQGITDTGSEAYKNAMLAQNQRENDLYNSAAVSGINIGNQARQQAIQEQSFFRNEPINTLNAVRSGSQVTTPNFTNTPGQAQVSGPDMMTAANNAYNAQMGDYNAQQAQRGQTAGAATSLLAAYIASGALASDIRLKHRIRRIGTHRRMGIGIYRYAYKGTDQLYVGVMAQELEKVNPAAVITMPSGYKAVKYGVI